MHGSYYINSYDSSIVLHPHSFFNYYEKLNYNRVVNIKKIIKYFNIKLDNLILYNNIIINYRNIFFDIFMQKLNIYFNKIRKNMFNLIYKFNILNLFQFSNNSLTYFNKLMNYLKINIICLNNKKFLLKENNVNISYNYVKKLYNYKNYKSKNKFL